MRDVRCPEEGGQVGIMVWTQPSRARLKEPRACLGKIPDAEQVLPGVAIGT